MPMLKTKFSSGDVVRITLCVMMALAIALAAFPADAKRKKRKSKRPAYQPPYASILVDYKSGQILRQQNADNLRHPASLTKMMTLYMVFDGLDSGLLTLDTELRVSERVAAQPRTKLYLKKGETIKVRDAVLGLVTKSANDAAMLLGEALAGTEERFARTMTLQARALGMDKTTFRNASGLPDKKQVTTARDMALLSIALIRDFPHYYHYFSTRQFKFEGRVHRNHNRMLRTYPGTDGIKTGFINDSGFNLAASVVRKGRRLVGVVMGGRSSSHRAGKMGGLFDYGYASLGVQKPKSKKMAKAVAKGGNSSPQGQKAMLPRPKPGSKTGWNSGIATVVDPNAQKTKLIAKTGVKKDSGIKTKPTAPGSEQTVAVLTSSTSGDAGASKMVVQPATRPNSATGPKPAAPVSLATARKEAAERMAASAGPNHTGLGLGVGSRSPLKSAARSSLSTSTSGSAYPANKQVRSAAKRNGAVEVTLSAIPKHPTQPGTIDRSAAKWGIQVGAFKQLGQARVALAQAINKAPTVLENAEVVIVPVDSDVGQFYRARILGMNSTRAQEACRVLHREQVPCIPLESPI